MACNNNNNTSPTFYVPNVYPYNANDPNDIVYRGNRAGVTQMYSPYQCGDASSQFWFLGTRRPMCTGPAMPLNTAPDNLRQQAACQTMYARY